MTISSYLEKFSRVVDIQERAFVKFLSMMPKSTFSRAVGSFAQTHFFQRGHQRAISAFVRLFRVDAQEAQLPASDYPTVGDFFTRRLKDGARPICAEEKSIISPVDGRVAAVGRAEEGKMFQAKGQDFSLSALLDDPLEGRHFEGGQFITLYLSPRDYHRIHVPCDAQVEGYSYIPGQLFPVNSLGLKWVPQLFCTNERLVTFLKSSVGRIAVVKVGALCVGRIRVSYDNIMTNVGGATIRRRYERPIEVKKGDELGLFELGSTVILIFEPNQVVLEPSISEGARVLVGGWADGQIGKVLSSSIQQ